jgi:hypothetical protein
VAHIYLSPSQLVIAGSYLIGERNKIQSGLKAKKAYQYLVFALFV